MSAPTTVTARQRVIYGDTDQMGVVYYANYLRYFELARVEYFVARGGDYPALEAAGLGLPVISAHVDYKLPARYEDFILVAAHVSELKRVSFTFSYELRREKDGALLATGYTVHACFTKATGRPTRLPERLVALIAG